MKTALWIVRLAFAAAVLATLVRQAAAQGYAVEGTADSAPQSESRHPTYNELATKLVRPRLDHPLDPGVYLDAQVQFSAPAVGAVNLPEEGITPAGGEWSCQEHLRAFKQKTPRTVDAHPLLTLVCVPTAVATSPVPGKLLPISR